MVYLQKVKGIFPPDAGFAGAPAVEMNEGDPGPIAFFQKIDYENVTFPFKYHDSNGNFKRKG